LVSEFIARVAGSQNRDHRPQLQRKQN